MEPERLEPEMAHGINLDKLVTEIDDSTHFIGKCGR